MGWHILRDKLGNDINSEILAVHAALLPTNRILYFGGDEHDPGRNVRGRRDPSVLHTFRLFDCGTNNISAGRQLDTDVFCCGHATLADGRLLVAGGTESYNPRKEDKIGLGEKDKPDKKQDLNPHAHFSGLPNAFIYDPWTQYWTNVPNMVPRPGQPDDSGGRWYPTLVTLPDGNIFTMSGHPSRDDDFLLGIHGPENANHFPGIFNPDPPPGRGRWRGQSALGDVYQSYYPRLHVLPRVKGTNRYIFTSSRLNQGDTWCYVFNPYDTTDYQRVCDLNGIDGDHFTYRYTSVLLPLLPNDGYEPAILLCGGPRPIIIYPNLGKSHYTSDRTMKLSPRRFDANSVLLPTGEVFICGGMQQTNESVSWRSETGRQVNQGEIYNFIENAWATTPPATVNRNYHSVALLMKDGRVWTAGSNKRGDYSYRYAAIFLDRDPINDPYRENALVHGNDEPDVNNREPRIEIFEPHYISAKRPQITSYPMRIQASDPLTAGDDIFRIQVSGAEEITSVAVLRTGSVTHAFNSDQRYIGLNFNHTDGDYLEVTAPPSEVTVPGIYLLFAIRGDTRRLNMSVPSEGQFVYILTEHFFASPQEYVLVEDGIEKPCPADYEIYKRIKSDKSDFTKLSREKGQT